MNSPARPSLLQTRATRVLLCAALAAAAFGQPVAALPEFEVASVKPNKSGSGETHTSYAPTQLVATNLSLRDYIRWAFAVKDFQIEGPDWLGSEHYDIAAKFPQHTGDKQVCLRLQKLLTDRFKLAVHSETKEFPVYALVPAKNGPKLKAAEDETIPGTGTFPGRIEGHHISMASLAELLSLRMDRPVVDRTGLQGVYDLTLDWIPDEAKAADKPGADPKPVFGVVGPTLLSALQRQLGLNLQSQKAPLEIIVVDHAEKVPVEN